MKAPGHGLDAFFPIRHSIEHHHHTLLVQDCELRHPMEFDHAGDIHVRSCPWNTSDLIASDGSVMRWWY